MLNGKIINIFFEKIPIKCQVHLKIIYKKESKIIIKKLLANAGFERTINEIKMIFFISKWYSGLVLSNNHGILLPHDQNHLVQTKRCNMVYDNMVSLHAKKERERELRNQFPHDTLMELCLCSKSFFFILARIYFKITKTVNLLSNLFC